MKYEVIDSFKAKTSKGEVELGPGQIITLPEDLAQKLIGEGKVSSIDKPSKEEVLSLGFSEFKTQNLAVKIRSKILCGDIWLVSNESVREHLKSEELACYLPDEILHLKGLSQEAIRSINEVKKVFEKSRLIK